jgi:hypothetical protein
VRVAGIGLGVGVSVGNSGVGIGDGTIVGTGIKVREVRVLVGDKVGATGALHPGRDTSRTRNST